uniref:unspecific monooxygenase n=1 Tax=Streltzoviella insularis TaxID=1206366 RepID=A0A7D5UMT0_9NEOP|nr:cytochrome P450 23 [Streltzoviella insularis]
MKGVGTEKLLFFILEEWKLILLLTIIFALYSYYTSTFDFFEKKGIKYMKPTIFLGNLGPRLFPKKSYYENQLDIYNYFKGSPCGGMFEGTIPILYIFNPDLLKAITIRDFDYFVDRNSLNSNKPRFLSRSLLNLKGSEWKGVRSILTPSFSSSRLKNMLPLLESCSQQMIEYLNKYDNKDVEMKDAMGYYTLETIGVCAFGIKCDALSDENAHFAKVVKKFMDISLPKRIYILLVLMLMPKMIRYLNISFINPEATGELVKMLKATKAERRASNVKRNDFLQLVLDAADEERHENGKREIHLDDDTIDAQSLLFLIAGYETSSTLLSFAIYVMATKPELQSKLRNHVIEVIKGKDLDYDVLSQLSYLEAFLLETLRMYTPISRVDRVCTKDYTLPMTSIRIKAGDLIALPLCGVHMDPDIYPNPHEFRPERFMGEEKNQRPSHLFLAFGAGPRNCIGSRFAMFSVKLAMVSLLKNFKFTTGPKTEIPVKFNKKRLMLSPENGLWVHVEKL